MAQKKQNIQIDNLKDEIFTIDGEGLKTLVQTVIQQLWETEMTECLGAAKSERSGGRLGYRSGYSPRNLITRVGVLELRIPQDRDGRFSTELFERYSRSEKALFGLLTEMYIQGVSTRKVKAVTEELCGHGFSSSSVSRMCASMDESLKQFADRPLEREYPYLILDARYEKVRENGIVSSRAVLIAVGIDWEGKRSVLGVGLANRESKNSWRDFLISLKTRGLRGVEFAVTDDHDGLRRAIGEILPEAVWQRCYVHFRRNALDYLPRKADDDCLRELKWMYERRALAEVKRGLALWLDKWAGKYPKLCAWVEDNIEETLSFYTLPFEHRKHMKSTNMLERFNEELKRRTRVVRIFPNTDSCLRLILALAVEQDEDWIEGPRYINMDLLKEHKKLLLRKSASAA